MHEELISVIIPVYNTAEYLPRCLESVLNNTYRNLEVICINDGSKDNSIEVLNAYAQKDSRIRVIDQENAGVSAARNRGLDEVVGEYIAFVDSDDWIHRQYFEVLLASARDHDAQIAICNYTMLSHVPADAELTADQTAAQEFTHAQLAGKDIPSWGRLYRRDSIGDVRFDQSITLAEDTVFSLELIRRNPELKLCKCEAAIYYYFTREGSLVHTLPEKKLAPLVRYYLGSIGTFGNQEVENICLLRSFKTMFLWRYRTMFTNDPESVEILRPLMKRACAELHKAQGISFANKVFYLTIARLPIAYRLFRIASDPTMLGWERLQRKKARAEKNQS